MKGRTLVIGIILFVVIVVGLIYFLMKSTINQIKEENNAETTMAHVQINNWQQLSGIAID